MQRFAASDTQGISWAILDEDLAPHADAQADVKDGTENSQAYGASARLFARGSRNIPSQGDNGKGKLLVSSWGLDTWRGWMPAEPSWGRSSLKATHFPG